MTCHIWFLLVLVVIFKIKSGVSDQSCQISEKPKLQIAFVIAYSLNKEFWAQFQHVTAKFLIDEIVNEFPDTQFAVTGFTDYPDNAQPRYITKEDDCYIFVQDFTNDKQKIVSAIEADKGVLYPFNYKGDAEDSLTTAMLFTAVEKKLKWNSGFYDRGNIVRKIMIPMVFRNITKILRKPGNRNVPKADGSDNCRNALPPTMKQLNRVLFDHKFTVVNAIANTVDNSKKYLKEIYYADEFARVVFPYYQVGFPGGNQLMEDKKTYDYEKYAKLIFGKIKEEVMSCDWEDPGGYNTLGL